MHALMKVGIVVFLAASGFAAHAGACPEDNRWKARLLEQVNLLRAAGGMCSNEGSFAPGAPVRWNPALELVAAAQAAWMAERGTLAHQGPRGESLGDRARQAEYAFERVAENIAHGYQELEEVMQAWRTSEKHCRNLLDPRFTEVALACVRAPDGPWWSIALGRPAAPGNGAAVSRTAWFRLPSMR